MCSLKQPLAGGVIRKCGVKNAQKRGESPRSYTPFRAKIRKPFLLSALALPPRDPRRERGRRRVLEGGARVSFDPRVRKAHAASHERRGVRALLLALHPRAR